VLPPAPTAQSLHTSHYKAPDLAKIASVCLLYFHVSLLLAHLSRKERLRASSSSDCSISSSHYKAPISPKIASVCLLYFRVLLLPAYPSRNERLRASSNSDCSISSKEQNYKAPNSPKIASVCLLCFHVLLLSAYPSRKERLRASSSSDCSISSHEPLQSPLFIKDSIRLSIIFSCIANIGSPVQEREAACFLQLRLLNLFT
jgi:hypothetical protein